MNEVLRLIALILQIMVFAIFARAILSWFVPAHSGNALVNVLIQITEPILAPFRRIIPQFGMMDLSPLVAIIVLQVISRVLLASIN